MEARAFAREDFGALLRLIADNAARRPTGHTYFMTSDVAWQFPGCGPKENVRLWWDGPNLVAYAWFQPPDTVVFDAHSERRDYAGQLEEALDWAERRRRTLPPSYPFYVDLNSMEAWAEAVRNPVPEPSSDHRYLFASALESDQQRMAYLADHGFAATVHFEPILTCDLQSVVVPEPPAAFSVRHVAEADFDARVALHAAAWAPASGFTMERYLAVRAVAEVFDPELDIVAVAQDGTFASYTIAWTDSVSLIGSFEPFGTRPAFRGSGVSQAVIYEGFRRLRDKGMRHARIYTAGFNHPAARLYQSCGFRQVDVSRTMQKRLAA